MHMLNVIASLASIVGLFVSIWTLVVARDARAAANEAREAVRQGNAAEEFSALSTTAGEFLAHVEKDQVAEACIRARDLMSAMSISSRRWRRFLSGESRKRFDEAYEQISIISRSLSANGAPASPEQKTRLLEISYGVVKTLGTEAGAFFSRVEKQTEE